MADLKIEKIITAENFFIINCSLLFPGPSEGRSSLPNYKIYPLKLLKP
jgi:hypothetical protein